MYNFDNYSHEYKTRKSFGLGNNPVNRPIGHPNVMSVFNAKRGNSSQDSPRKFQVHYVFARANQSTHRQIDRRANGGLSGADMRVLQKTHSKINIVGIDDHELTGLNILTVAPLMDTQKGPISGIFHEYAHLGKGRLIHAAGQTE